MAKFNEIDLQGAHRYFSVRCFNKAWDLIDHDSRSPEQDEEMLQLSMASLWHWNQREDCTDTNLSIANWQISRVYAVLGRGDEARRYAKFCLEVSQRQGVGLFYLAYAYEALSRAEKVVGNRAEMQEFRATALSLAGEITDVDSREMLLSDLKTISE